MRTIPPEDPVGMCARHEAGALRSRVTAAQLSEAPYPFANEIKHMGVWISCALQEGTDGRRSYRIHTLRMRADSLRGVYREMGITDWLEKAEAEMTVPGR